MYISELIEQLEQIKKENGDLLVEAEVEHGCCPPNDDVKIQVLENSIVIGCPN